MGNIMQGATLLKARACGEENGSMIRCALALTLTFSEYWLLNYSAFPLFDLIFIWTREVSACVGGAALAAIAVLSFWRPRPLDGRVFTWGVVFSMTIGGALCAVGALFESVFFTVAGASLVIVGGGLANICVGLGCIGLTLRRDGIVVVWSYVASFVLRGLFHALPFGANLAMFLLFPLCAVALSARLSLRARDFSSNDSPAQISVTTPGSFVPFGHQVFVSLVVFRFVYGYSLTFGEVDRVPVVAFSALAALCAVAVYVFASSKPLSSDGLFRVSILVSVAGFLVLSITGAPRDALASSLLSAGTGIFEILMYYVLIAIGAKNPTGALSVFAWGNAMASWGTILGAVFGRATNEAYRTDGTVLAIISAVIVFVLVAYVLFVLGSFSFSKTIESVSPSVDVKVVEEKGGDGVEGSLEERCSRLAEDACLTEREREVFLLLAHGRNARYIQETLVVSYNTVKTHVSHVYAKLGVHSHQELIDLVESKG